MFQKLKLSKSVSSKKCAPKFIMIHDLKKKIQIYLWWRKLTLKVQFWHFLPPPHYLNSQNTIFSFDYVDFWPKIITILYPSHGNSTTHVTINEQIHVPFCSSLNMERERKSKHLRSIPRMLVVAFLLSKHKGKATVHTLTDFRLKCFIIMT